MWWPVECLDMFVKPLLVHMLLCYLPSYHHLFVMENLKWIAMVVLGCGEHWPQSLWTPETVRLSGLMPLEIDLWMDDQWPLRYAQLIWPYTKTINNQEIYHGHHCGRFHPYPLSISSIIQHCCAIMTQGQDCKVDQSCLGRCTNLTHKSQVPLNYNGPTSTNWSQQRNEESQLSIHRDYSR